MFCIIRSAEQTVSVVIISENLICDLNLSRNLDTHSEESVSCSDLNDYVMSDATEICNLLKWEITESSEQLLFLQQGHFLIRCSFRISLPADRCCAGHARTG